MVVHLLKAKAFPMFFVCLLVLISVGSTAVAQQVDQDEAAEDEQTAEEGADAYTGTWSLVVGPSRLEWQLEADTYEFYAYQAGTVRIGSRGDLVAEDGQLRFIAREITNDGESWSEVELPEEEATAAFAYEIAEVTVRPDSDQTGDGAEAGEGDGADAQPGTAEDAADQADTAQPDAEEPSAGEAEAAEVEQRQVLRLALPGRPQFYTDYQADAGDDTQQ